MLCKIQAVLSASSLKNRENVLTVRIVHFRQDSVTVSQPKNMEVLRYETGRKL